MNVAFIPVRGGSKSIPLKNIKVMCGKPLVYWTIKAACDSKYIDRVYVASDSNVIRKTVEEFKREIGAEIFEKVVVIDRSAESASDTASTEFAMLEFAEQYDFDNIALIQATSPLLQATDLDRGFETFNEEGVDSVLSVVPQKRFNWEKDKSGYAHSSNYDVYKRPLRQEFKGYFVENGAFYITSKEALMRTQNRLSGNIKLVEMDEDSFFEIDESGDWDIIEAIMKKDGTVRKFKMPEIRMLLTDCDGCLTDGGMYYSERGDELKKFNTKDGMGFKLLRERGVLTGIITGEKVELNRRRAEKLNLDVYIDGCDDKLTAIENICNQYNICIKNVCYIGDDVNDIEAVKAVGFGCCPSNANKAVRDAADFVTKAKGGDGVLREIVDLLVAL